jgi:NAD(P)-dependent dehydrogenase (short-subunit alcohol dehydrogenase family)
MRARLAALAALGGALAAREALLRAGEADLRGRSVLVTGGSRGLGLVLAREFLREGAGVAICARDAAELERAREILEPEGEVLTTVCDVAQPAQVEAWVAAARERFGPVDVLVNNAGIISLAPIRNLRRDDLAETMDVMFWGTVNPTLAVLPEMLRRREGRLVMITSLGGKITPPHVIPYSTAKAAAIAFAEGLRAELAQEGITVVTIVPGFMRTGSDVQVLLKGGWRRDFLAWAIGANVPGISIDVERAARRIVQATKRGEPEVILTFPAEVVTRLHALAPGLSLRIFSLAARFLPRSDSNDPARIRAMELQRAPHPRLLDVLRAWSRSAGRRFNQYGEAGEHGRVSESAGARPYRAAPAPSDQNAMQRTEASPSATSDQLRPSSAER